MPVVRSYMKMLRRNLLYTGITRAKNFLILCGDPDVFKFGIERNDDLARLTSLKERLIGEGDQEVVTADDKALQTSAPAGASEQVETVEAKEQEEAALTASNYLSIHPLIGMSGTTPYDFLEE